MAASMEGVESPAHAASASGGAPGASNLYTFDLDSCVAGLTGHGRLLRLLFIARSEHPEYSDEALRMGLSLVQETNNVSMYHAFAELAQARFPDFQEDQEWVDATSAECARRKEKLEFEVNDIKQSLIRESVRMAMENQYTFLYQCGDLKGASAVCAKMKSYHTTTRHAVDQALMMVKLGLEMDNLVTAHNYANQGLESDDPAIFSCFSAAKGLASMRSEKYDQAAQSFVSCNVSMGNQFSEVISCAEVGLFGGLCCLASFTRRDIKNRVLDHGSFKEFLELVPHVRDLISSFYHTKYDQCLGALNALREEASLNMHLSLHFDKLYNLIRQKALCQYTQPFVSVDLRRMAENFGTAPGDLMHELEELIQGGKIRARIDSHKMVLYAASTDQRESTYQKVMDVGEQVNQNSEAILRSISAAQNKLIVRGKARDSHEEEMMGDAYAYEQGPSGF